MWTGQSVQHIKCTSVTPPNFSSKSVLVLQAMSNYYAEPKCLRSVHSHTSMLEQVRSRTFLPSKVDLSTWDGFIHHSLFLCPSFHLNSLCIFTMALTCASREREHARGRQTHTCMQRQMLAARDLQPGTITCDLATLELVTNSILGQLIRHAWALGFLYVVIKARVYGHPRALGWIIVLTSSEPKATHSWGEMGHAGRGTPI